MTTATPDSPLPTRHRKTRNFNCSTCGYEGRGPTLLARHYTHNPDHRPRALVYRHRARARAAGTPTVDPAIRYCSYCATARFPTARFCHTCGTAFPTRS